MKKIGLVIADKNEIHEFNEFKYIRKYKSNNFKVWKYGFLNRYLIFVIHSKIGVVNAAIATQYLIDNFNVKEIWNYGAVGGSDKLEIEQVVIPQRFYYFDVKTPWYPLSQVPNEDQYYLNAIKESDNFNLASGHSFINSHEELIKIKELINIDLIDMESCAIAQTCKINNIGFYCVKAISDIIGKTNSDKKEDINLAIKNASKKAFQKMIEILTKY